MKILIGILLVIAILEGFIIHRLNLYIIELRINTTTVIEQQNDFIKELLDKDEKLNGVPIDWMGKRSKI